MAEYTSDSVQTVSSGQNILFTETPVAGTRCIQHRSGSGLVTLRGLTNQSNARFLITFGANAAIPTGQTVGSLSAAISISGEPINNTTMIVTPADVEEYFNISSSTYVIVPKGCCITIAVKNTSAIPIEIQNANLIVTRVS